MCDLKACAHSAKSFPKRHRWQKQTETHSLYSSDWRSSKAYLKAHTLTSTSTINGGYKKYSVSCLWSNTNRFKWHCDSDRLGGGKLCHVIWPQTPKQLRWVFWDGQLEACQQHVMYREKANHVERTGEATVTLLSSWCTEEMDTIVELHLTGAPRQSNADK